MAGIEVDEDRIRENLNQSLALATGIAPVIGYDQAADISKEAYQSGRTVRSVAEERDILTTDKLDKVLDPYSMTEPGFGKQ